ncbi:DUF6807 family protein [Microbacterium sp. Marseille-Q6648]|uniref:DUF6807 family protein n=1 Tax=Microbacterium sp. Marseille-Q6648 TaxID=2937991 RepID=UPI002040A04F|nr:DUF6807 family protein [Microbacterium sp. Marseille-Q6648]
MTIDLLRHDAVRVRYHDGDDLDGALSPRPFLTATTETGAAVTEVGPADHPHHLGLSVALADVNGTSFWGGRTFRRRRGSTLLRNHGTQRVRARDFSGGAVSEVLTWSDHHGAALLEERRRIEAVERADGWELSWRTTLTAVAADVTIASPQTNGRDGAFYGGIFWRTPFGSALVRTLDGEGIDAAHGSTSPWLALEAGGISLVAATSTGMPWFVRNEGYVGFGPAVAVAGPRELAVGDALHLDLAVAVQDRAAPDEVCARLLDTIGEPV